MLWWWTRSTTAQDTFKICHGKSPCTTSKSGRSRGCLLSFTRDRKTILSCYPFELPRTKPLKQESHSIKEESLTPLKSQEQNKYFIPNYWMRLCILVAEEQKVTGLRHSWGCVLEKIAIEQKWVPGCEVAKGEVDLHFTHAMPKTSWIIYGSLPFIATRPWDSLLNDLAVNFFS